MYVYYDINIYIYIYVYIYIYMYCVCVICNIYVNIMYVYVWQYISLPHYTFTCMYDLIYACNVVYGSCLWLLWNMFWWKCLLWYFMKCFYVSFLCMQWHIQLPLHTSPMTDIIITSILFLSIWIMIYDISLF